MCHLSLCHNLSNREAEAWSTVFRTTWASECDSLNYGVGQIAAIMSTCCSQGSRFRSQHPPISSQPFIGTHVIHTYIHEDKTPIAHKICKSKEREAAVLTRRPYSERKQEVHAEAGTSVWSLEPSSSSSKPPVTQVPRWSKASGHIHAHIPRYTYTHN